MLKKLLESSHRDVGFGEKITQVQSIEVNFTHLIWSSGNLHKLINAFIRQLLSS